METLRTMPALVATPQDFQPAHPDDKLADKRAGKSIPPLGLKLDEPGGTIPLGVNPSLACPGFYVLTIGDGPESGVQRGSFGAELLLLSPGSRILAGGLNFGGQMDSSAPGYAAFTIANPNNENQLVNINLTGYRPLTGNPNIRLRVTLERRLPSLATVVSQVVTVGANSPYVTTAVVSPGFYVATVEPLDFLSGADGVFGMSLLSNYVDRPGGGFQGGVVVGGYHDPFANPTSGFAGFCLADAHNVQLRTESRPTRGSAGAGDLRVVLATATGQVVFANPGSAAPPPDPDFGDTCASAASVTLNSTITGTISPSTDLDFLRFTVSSPSTVTAQAASVFDSLGRFYDGNCAVLAEDDDSAGNLDFRLQRVLNPGTYYLRVSSFQGASGGAYTVSLNSTSSGTSGTLRIDNRLIYPVSIRANGTLLGSASANSIVNFSYAGSSSVEVSWDLQRPTINGTSTQIGETMGGSFSSVTLGNGATQNFTIDNVVGSTPYFVPRISNSTSAQLLMGVNVGLAAQNLCNCVVPAFGQNIALGYYRLFSNSNVRGYRTGSGYTGPYIFWGSASAGASGNLPSLVQAGSGLLNLSATTAP